MKKIISILFTCCFLFSYCQTKTDTLTNKFNSWSSLNLNGKVKEITVKSFKVDTLNNRIISKKQEKLYNRTKFSKEGQELIYEILDKQNTIISRSVPEYKNGLINKYISKNIKEKTSENWIVTKHLFNFYAAEMEFYVNDTLAKTTINTANEKGHQTNMKIFDNENRLIQERKLEYDKNGDLIKTVDEIKTKNLADTIHITSTYRYIKFDKNNNWITRIDKTNDDYLLSERQIEYY